MLSILHQFLISSFCTSLLVLSFLSRIVRFSFISSAKCLSSISLLSLWHFGHSRALADSYFGSWRRRHRLSTGRLLSFIHFFFPERCCRMQVSLSSLEGGVEGVGGRAVESTVVVGRWRGRQEGLGG